MVYSAREHLHFLPPPTTTAAPNASKYLISFTAGCGADLPLSL